MGGKSSKEDDADGERSKKPADTAFKQQRLPAWQPIITANMALPVILSIGLIFIAIGIVLVITSERIFEYDVDYTDTNCLSDSSRNKTCAAVLKDANGTNVTCTCTTSIFIKENMTGDIFFYYGLVNFYQNHRRYVQSRDDNQLMGKNVSVTDKCEPFQKATSGNRLDFTPCGAIANSLFNDSFILSLNGNDKINVIFDDIAWSTDKQVKFHNPPNAENVFNTNPSPLYWRQNAWKLNRSLTDGQGYENEGFIVWMRTAAMPTFKKLYGKSTRKFLQRGNYSLQINYNYPVASFSGRKQFIISTTSWMGGKNPFLGWAYITVGIISCLTFVTFFILHQTWKLENLMAM